MEEIYQTINEFFSKPGIFECSDLSDVPRHLEIPIKHRTNRLATEKKIQKLEKKIKRNLTPSHKKILSIWNGCILFCQKTSDGTVGVELYSTKKLPLYHTAIYNEIRELLIEEHGNTEPAQRESLKNDITNWLPKLLIIGEELMADNYIAIDYSKNSVAGEHPIVLLSHEHCYSDQTDVIADNVADFLLLAIKDPPYFLHEILGGVTTYSDGSTDEEWFPDRYKIPNS